MNIPEKAYEAATRAEWDHWGPSWHTLTYETDTEYREYLASQTERAVNASAPFVEAQALRATADRYRGKAKALREVAGITKTQFPMAVAVLLDLADELDSDAAELEKQ